MEKNTTGIRKRQQITRANQAMFLWVAGAAVVIGFSVVIGIFLWQKIAFSEKVISAKATTAKTLTKNLEVVDTLRSNVRVLDTDENLKATRLKDDDLPIQSVLDALPADANSTALGSSLQAKLLSGVNGVTLESIKVEPVAGIETDVESTSANLNATNQINFSFSVSVNSNNPNALRDVLLRLERSIRPINITSLDVESQGARLVLSASGHAYYEPAKSIQLKDEVIRP
jgi:hypothetical protein